MCVFRIHLAAVGIRLAPRRMPAYQFFVPQIIDLSPHVPERDKKMLEVQVAENWPSRDASNEYLCFWPPDVYVIMHQRIPGVWHKKSKTKYPTSLKLDPVSTNSPPNVNMVGTLYNALRE